MSNFLTRLAELGPDAGLVSAPEQVEAAAQDWRGRFRGQPLALLAPVSTQALAQVMALAHAEQVPVVPQGGNTGLAGGATPDASGLQLMVSTRKLTSIRRIDPANRSITLEAGVTLAQAQAAAEALGLWLPLDLGARDSATIGGLLSTNAGGTAVLRYGNARAQCLGLEVVTADGQVWHGLSGLRKDNTGYALRDLFIGSEGSLGIITAATLALQPRPKSTATALLGLPANLEAGAALRQAIALLRGLEDQLGPQLVGFEVMGPQALTLLHRTLPERAGPFQTQASPGLWLLVEAVSHQARRPAQDLLQEALADAPGLVSSTEHCLLAQSAQQGLAFWAAREAIPLASAEDGAQVKLDLSLPISALPEFCTRVLADLAELAPGWRAVWFGHLGDGNLHFNLAPPLGPEGESREDRRARHLSLVTQEESRLRALVHDRLMALGGSISAEHGLGQLRAQEAWNRRDPVASQLMRAIKQAFDPDGRLNPGKVLPGRSS